MFSLFTHIRIILFFQLLVHILYKDGSTAVNISGISFLVFCFRSMQVDYDRKLDLIKYSAHSKVFLFIISISSLKSAYVSFKKKKN